MFENITLEQFLGHDGEGEDGANTAAGLVAVYSNLYQKPVKFLKSYGEFSFSLVTFEGDIIVTGENGEWIGFYIDSTIYVDSHYSCKGLGTALVLHSYQNGRKKFGPRKLSKNGKATLLRAYYVGRGTGICSYWP